MTPKPPGLPPPSAHPAGLVSPTFLALALVALALAAARLAGLDGLLVWHDEVYTLVRAFGFSDDDVQRTLFAGRALTPAELLFLQGPDPARGWSAALGAFVSHPEHAPLYYALVRATALALAPLGVEPLSAARGVSALAGALTIPAAFLLARVLFGRGAVPWVAGLLTAASPMLFLYAQEARQYALWVLWVALATAALVWATRAPGRSARWWLYGVLLALGLYSHVLFALMLPVHGLYVLIARAPRQPRASLGPWMIAAGAALLAFGPWAAVLVGRHQAAINNTEWMSRAIGWVRNLGEWSNHLTRVFVDLNPGPAGWWALVLVPLGAAVVAFLWRAPRPAVWLPAGIAVVYIGIVLAPDLVLGGSRSQHVRYGLPAMLAILLMVAWVLGRGLESVQAGVRLGSGLAIALLVVLGGASILAIARSDTWWTKHISITNAVIARELNRAERPLVVAGRSGISAGELISLAHRLDGQVRLWGLRRDRLPDLTAFSPILALMPSPDLRARLGPGYGVEPVPDTWQWFWIRPVLPEADPPTTTRTRP